MCGKHTGDEFVVSTMLVLKLNRENTQLSGEIGQVKRENARLTEELDAAKLEAQLLRAQVVMLEKANKEMRLAHRGELDTARVENQVLRLQVLMLQNAGTKKQEQA